MKGEEDNKQREKSTLRTSDIKSDQTRIHTNGTMNHKKVQNHRSSDSEMGCLWEKEKDSAFRNGKSTKIRDQSPEKHSLKCRMAYYVGVNKQRTECYFQKLTPGDQ